jgi:hypothetical protein
MNFARAVHNWEVDAFVSFLKMLYSARMRREGEGCLVLNPSTGSWIVVMMVSVSLGRVFGELKFH